MNKKNIQTALIVLILILPTILLAQSNSSGVTCRVMKVDMAGFQAMAAGFGVYAAIAGVVAPEAFFLIAVLAISANVISIFAC